MRIDGVVFDLDGTLTDSMHIWNEAPKALVRRWPGVRPRRPRTLPRPTSSGIS